jgi:cytochrome c peroxidase
MNIKLASISLILFVVFTSAITISGDPVLPATPFNYSILNLPSAFTTDVVGAPRPTSISGVDNTPATNPVTDAGATLGRVLFYDVNLSSNRTVSCASCHKQNAGFTDPSVLSTGFAGGKTGRHSMTLINARYYQRGRAFWDERAATFEDQVLMPFQDATEMGMTLTTLLQRINEKSYYTPLFNAAFGDNSITSDRVSKALAQFVRSIVSYSSKYDAGRAQVGAPGTPFPNFTAQENSGKQLFFAAIPNGGGACFGCHTTEAFVNANGGPENNGIDAVSTTDLGAGGPNALNRTNLIGRFKTPSLRNIELTAPFMHDGRFQTLEQVVEHYNSGIQAHPTLSPALKDANGNPVRLNFNATQKAALVAFLKTLTDNSIATETKWSNPFPAPIVPIELINFSGKLINNKIILEWQTASEINNDYFTIEKSLDGNSWEDIGQIKGAENAKSIQNYTFNDLNIINSRQYYRLKQTDFNKKFTYSKIISVELNTINSLKINVFPNPTTHEITINFDNLALNNNTELQLINSIGQIVFAKNKLINNSEIINLSAFPNGQYFILIKSNGEVISRKLIKH